MKTDINLLLDSYFEGTTTCEEEQQLRDFFAHTDIPEDLLPYKPLFDYFEQEIGEVRASRKKETFSHKVLIWSLSGVAAVVLLLIGLFTFHGFQKPCLCVDNYVIIDGHCYTDKNTVKQYALQALRQVSSSPAEGLVNMSDDENKQIVETELNRLGNLLEGSDF